MFRESSRKILLVLIACGMALAVNNHSAIAQRARFGDTFVIPNARINPPMIQVRQPAAAQSAPGLNLPNGQLPQIGNTLPPGGIPQPVFQSNPPVVIQQPAFDPFAIQTPNIINSPAMSFPGQLPQSIQPPPYIYPPPATAVPGAYGPATAIPNPQPSVTGSWASSAMSWPNEAWARLRSSQVYRLLERPRFRHTYLAAGNDPQQLGLNESEVAMTLSIPNFLWSGQPIRISPGFVWHFWEGPVTSPAVMFADLPARTYSAYLSFDFSTPWDRQLGAELNFTVGHYSDFQNTNSDSIRLTGVGLGWFRLNNTTTFKLGVEYLDRVRVKLLPAIGFFIYPTPDMKFDLYFPRPRFAHRLRNLGNYEVWAYVGGEYGGGSWTIERLGPVNDRFDMNDIRLMLGMEWMGPRRVTGFFETGYVFDRELIYGSSPNVEVDINDTFMFRAGIAF